MKTIARLAFENSPVTVEFGYGTKWYRQFTLDFDNGYDGCGILSLVQAKALLLWLETLHLEDFHEGEGDGRTQ